jgi:alpha-mannosidase
MIKEILVLHHTHVDIGYTHPQGVIWELYRRFMDRALAFCDETADWPEESRFRWTVECTWPLLDWLERAVPGDVERFRAAVARGQMGAGALPMNMTPLSDAGSLVEGLRPLEGLRRDFGLPLKVAIGHDINGLPWTSVPLMCDAGVGMLIMGINVAFGGYPLTRPLPFRWEGPDGRRIFAFNGEHYNEFYRMAHYFASKNIGNKELEKAVKRFLEEKLPADWPFSFAFLTATHPYCSDNNPPVRDLARIIRAWNDAGHKPAIRMILPEDLLEAVRREEDKLETWRGDWTDYWNFGAGSMALETAVCRRGRERARVGRWVAAAGGLPPDAGRDGRFDEAVHQCLLYEEHTFVCSASCMDPETEEIPASFWCKSSHAWRTRDAAAFALRETLEALAGNTSEGELAGLLLVNPSGRDATGPVLLPDLMSNALEDSEGQTEIGEDFVCTGKRDWDHLLPRQFQVDMMVAGAARSGGGVHIGPFTVPAYGCLRVPFKELAARRLPPPAPFTPSGNSLASDHFSLSFDPQTGRVLSLEHNGLGRILEAAAHPVFGFVRETPADADPSAPMLGREAFMNLDWRKLHQNISGWRTGWQAVHEGPRTLRSVRCLDSPEGAELRLDWQDAPGVSVLRQRIVLSRHHPEVVFEAVMVPDYCVTPVAFMFVWPTVLEAGWQAHFDTAGMPVELDAGQLPGSCRDYVTVDRWACMHDRHRCLSLACPDAPLVQFGAFGFGRHQASVPREAHPLLIGWPANNYWNTNFMPAQPHPIKVRYVLRADQTHRPEEAAAFAERAMRPVEFHPLTSPSPTTESPALMTVDPAAVRVLALQRSADGTEILLANPSDGPASARVSLPLLQASSVRSLDASGLQCAVEDGTLFAEMPARTIRRLLLLS